MIAERDKNRISTIETRETLTRLGSGRSDTGELSKEAMQRVLSALRFYMDLIRAHAVSDVRLFATSATRDAANQQAFLKSIRRETGYSCRVLTGEQEANLSFLGALSDIDPVGSLWVVDMGGGSTEMIHAYAGRISSVYSLEMGSQRFAATIQNDPPCAQDLERIKTLCKHQLEQIESPAAPDTLLCLGGTVSTLAMIHKKLPLTDALQAHHTRLSAGNLAELVTVLSGLPVSLRRSLTGLHPERAGLVLPGAVMMKCIADFFNQTVTVSLRDLLYGIFLQDNSSTLISENDSV
ncbi:MAG: hypothetical protein U5R06_10190 [candidate division KSB1 bacterium]|nr:hypothetical protein [candidate division KSB1 bacterium]